MKVKVELMTMCSAPGYVPSSGYTQAIVVPAEVAVSTPTEDDLWALEGRAISADDLEDASTKASGNGVLTYETTTGVYDVPNDHVVVQRRHVNICTDDGPRRSAWIVNAESLKEFYRQRAEMYARMAE